MLLSGILLGKWYGGLSQSLYVGIGSLGMPWFANGKGGLTIIFGITGGYLIGFILAATVIGWFTERYIRVRTFSCLIPLILLGIGLIYAVGALQFSLIMRTRFSETMKLAVLPFIPADITKAVIVGFISRTITTRYAYNGEIDRDKWKHWKLP